jgi:hypothetical protein
MEETYTSNEVPWGFDDLKQYLVTGIEVRQLPEFEDLPRTINAGMIGTFADECIEATLKGTDNNRFHEYGNVAFVENGKIYIPNNLIMGEEKEVQFSDLKHAGQKALQENRIAVKAHSHPPGSLQLEQMLRNKEPFYLTGDIPGYCLQTPSPNDMLPLLVPPTFTASCLIMVLGTYDFNYMMIRGKRNDTRRRYQIESAEDAKRFLHKTKELIDTLVGTMPNTYDMAGSGRKVNKEDLSQLIALVDIAESNQIASYIKPRKSNDQTFRRLTTGNIPHYLLGS